MAELGFGESHEPQCFDILAVECENVLGPAGVKAVQVSPPNEHSIVPSKDWSQRYQPVSYSVARSRSGTGTEFQDMVTRCAAAGAPFRNTARELLAFAALKAEDFDAAARWLDAIVVDAQAPQSIKSRAEALIGLVSAGK